MKGRKAKGTRGELRSRDYLRQRGYRVARFAGSFGPFDLFAASETAILLIQVKCGRWPSARELNAMRAFPAPGCLKAVHLWEPRAKQPLVRCVV